ncbi:uncharacterized protein Tco025E_02457 [Trypanosoma conorhini]|uniref:DUF4042 domain-containing protein n=1 Tax=Trypanosoma conorhini TaxID=83891 RepID=A0A3R7N2R3_9TRYP|nr:uncharacterized protein Tco025E_02457 [Trypanosoma conorhini]RNF24487.1 hypothetical protein Tco025E_02457 [Trypanosoma conorhini]
MLQLTLVGETEGAFRGSLGAFADALARDAEALVSGCGELVKMEAEASAVTQRQEPSEPTAVPAAEESASAWDKISTPSPPLYFAAVSKLNSLLHSMKLHATAGDGEERATAERVLLLLRVICLYCFATARPATGGHGEAPSQGSSGRTTPMTRLARRPGAAGNRPVPESETPGVETRMAEETFRVAVDAVVRLSVCGAARVVTRGTVSVDSTAKPVELCAEVNLAALCLLTAALVRFRNAEFNATRYLPALFPEIDARDPSTIHPLLTPLLWGPEERLRAAAAALVAALLRKLQPNFKYAEEPQRKRQSFSSLASQGGRTLASLHDVLLYSLQLSSGPPALRKTSAAAAAASHFSTGLVFSTFAVLVATTPYRRCPHSFEVVQQTLELPLLRDALLDASCEEFASATTFLSSVFKADSLASVVRAYLAAEGGDVGATSTGPRHPPPDRRAGRGALLLEVLLTHAARRVGVWRCVVQLSRMHPWIVGTHFAILMDAARAVLRAAPKNMEEAAAAEKTGNVAVGNTLGECLRAWLHFMGYVWHSFDGHSADPALGQDYEAHRATPQQKERILTELVLPVLRMTPSGPRYTEAWRTALRCVAQLGNEFFSAMPATLREGIVAQVISSTTAHEGSVRSEAFTTIGVWAWQYSTFENWLTGFVERAASAMCGDAEPEVRSKAAFAISNITSRLGEETDLSPLRQSPYHMQLLCDVAMYATQAREDAAVVGHGIRMMSHLLHSLSFEELIAELSEEQECVAEGYLNALLRFLLPSNRDAKLRWNAACALGLGLSREVVFEAEPPAATRAVERLCVIVCHDRIFKVRTQAAVALAKVPMTCLSSGRYTVEDLAPKVTRALCEALQASGGSTENFAQYKEQDALCAALRQALGVMITSASPSAMLQRVFGEYRVMLEAEGLL